MDGGLSLYDDITQRLWQQYGLFAEYRRRAGARVLATSNFGLLRLLHFEVCDLRHPKFDLHVFGASRRFQPLVVLQWEMLVFTIPSFHTFLCA